MSHTRYKDNSAIGLSLSQMHDLNILQGDFLLVHGNNFTTILNADAHDLRHGTVSLSRDTQKSLEVQPAQVIGVQRCCMPAMVSSERFLVPRSTHFKKYCPDQTRCYPAFCRYIEKCCWRCFQGHTGSLSIKGFDALGRPAHRGDLFTVNTTDGRKHVQFEGCEMESDLGKVTSGIIGSETVIYCEGRPIERKERPDSERYQLPTTESSLVEYNAVQATGITRLPMHLHGSRYRN